MRRRGWQGTVLSEVMFGPVGRRALHPLERAAFVKAHQEKKTSADDPGTTAPGG